MKSVLRTFAAAILLAVMALGMYQPSAYASFDSGTRITIDDSAGQHINPAIEGSLVAYTTDTGDASNRLVEIRYFDLDSGETGTVPGNDGRDNLADVSGSTIVFTRGFDDRRAIMSFDVENQVVTELDATYGSARTFPAIGGSTVAWEDRGNAFDEGFESAEIFVYDLNGENPVRLTDDDVDDVVPVVSPDGSLIVWEKCENRILWSDGRRSNCEIWQASRSGSEWVTSQLTDEEHGGTALDTNGETIVYQSTRDEETDILWRPVGGGPEQRLSLDRNQFRPSISGDLISFESVHPDSDYIETDILVYDLSSGTLHQITDTPDSDEILSDIFIDDDGVATVVYDSDTGGERSIHAYVFNTQDADTTPPSLSLPGDLTVNADGPDGALVTYDLSAQDDTDPNPEVSCQPASGSLFPIGTTAVICTASDDAGNESEGSFNVTVLGADEQLLELIDLVDSLELNGGTANSLQSKLNNAVAALDSNSTDAACGMLGAFINSVEAQSGKKLTVEQADELIEGAAQARDAAGCS